MQVVDRSVSKQRRTLLTGGLAAVLLTLALWWGFLRFLPPVAGMETVSGRMLFALKCICVAVLLCFMTGVECVSHRRLFSPAIDPLAGGEDRALKIDLRYLQQTLEQLLLFIPGLLVLAAYESDMRIILAASAVWILSRFVFWIAYHTGPWNRAAGLTGMVQSMVILLYVCGRFGYELAGIGGAAAILGLFGIFEIVFFIAALRQAKRGA